MNHRTVKTVDLTAATLPALDANIKKASAMNARADVLGSGIDDANATTAGARVTNG